MVVDQFENMLCCSWFCIVVGFIATFGYSIDPAVSTSSCIVIESSNDFLEQLCHSSHKTVHMVLNSTKTYNITRITGFRCIIENATISISTNSTTTHSNVVCSLNPEVSPQPTLGIAFINSTVNISRVTMKYCGAYLFTLPMDIKDMFNKTSSLYYPTYFASALLFIECEVTMSEFIATSSFGFAVIGINLDKSTISKISFYSWAWASVMLKHHDRNIGNGILFHYLDNPHYSRLASKHMVIQDSQFQWNVRINTSRCGQYSDECCVTDIFADNGMQKKPVVASGVLTVLYNNKEYSATVNLVNILFSNNRARLVPLPTSLLILHYHANAYDTTNIVNSEVKTLGVSNEALSRCPVDSAEFGFYFYPSKNATVAGSIVYRPLHISNTVFRSQPHYLNVINYQLLKNIVYIGIQDQVPQANISITFSNVKIRTNYAVGQGTCLHVNTKLPMTLIMTSVAVYENKVLLMQVETTIGIILLRGPVDFIINGTKQNPSMFTNNNGIVIYSSTGTRLFLQGHVIFKSNIGSNGAAINLQGTSQLYLMNNSTILFEENRSVGLGGAIYAVTKKWQKRCSIFLPDVENSRLNVTFKRNFAVLGGSDIYAYPVFDCYYEKLLKSKSTRSTFEEIFFFQTTAHNVFSISTLPKMFSIIYSSSTTALFPGQKFNSCITAKDILNRSVFATIEAKILPERLRNQELNKDWLSMDVNTGPEQTIQEKQQCSNVSIVFHSTTEYGSIIHNNRSKRIMYYLKQTSQHRVVTPKLSGCPLGFVLKNNTGSCTCSRALKKLNMLCSIQTQTLSKPTDSVAWAGLIIIDKQEKFSISSNCPIGHCHSSSKLKWFYSYNNTLYLRKNPNSLHNFPMCVNNRNHALCSKCSIGLTEAFGTVKCIDCNRYTYYWLNILLFLLFGPLFILFLYTFRLTLAAGTMNGIIFYANFLNTGLINFLYNSVDNTTESVLKDIALGFLMFTNFRYGFAVCFFRSMSVYFKAASAFAFPYYLLLLVGLIVLVSRWSSWVSKHTSHSSVQVLVTVVHFSFSSVFIQVVTLFSWTTMYTDDGEHKVWLYDGSALFLTDPRHVNLVIGSLIAIFPVLFTYTFFLVFTKPSMKCSSKCNLYFRPLYEAIHAPYKEGKEYWFTMKLMLLVFTSIFWSFNTQSNSTIICIVTALLICAFFAAQGLFQPFKSRVIGLLDGWTLLNLLVVYISLLLPQNEIKKTTNILIVTTMLIIVTFIGVVIYHFILAFELNSKFNKRFSTIFKLHDGSFRQNSRVSVSTADQNDMSIESIEGQPLVNTVAGGSNEFYESFNGYREPLIDDY